MNDKEEILCAKGLQKTFICPQGKIQVLRDINLTVYAGESVSIRGESGSGKTTLLYLISRLEKAEAGELWSREVFFGFVFQGYYLIPELTALENVLFARRVRGSVRPIDRTWAKELLFRVGLANRMHHLPRQLSGGESQRVAVARALMNQPSLVLADEPTGNLDEKTAEEVMALLLTLCQQEQKSLILVTHNPKFAAQTTRQLLLRHGELWLMQS